MPMTQWQPPPCRGCHWAAGQAAWRPWRSEVCTRSLRDVRDAAAAVDLYQSPRVGAKAAVASQSSSPILSAHLLVRRLAHPAFAITNPTNFVGSRASITTRSPLAGEIGDDPRPCCGAERAEAPRGTRCRVYTARTRRSARRVRADSGLNVARRQPTAWAACGGQRAVGRLRRSLAELRCFLVAATARAAEVRQRRCGGPPAPWARGSHSVCELRVHAEFFCDLRLCVQVRT